MATRDPFLVIRAEHSASAATIEQLPEPMFLEVAFAGRSNVGKSTLLNRLTNQHRLARTSSTPGCTRQIVFFKATLGDGATLNLVDLPGYGYAKRSRTERKAWAEVLDHYLSERSTLRVVAILIDARRGPEEEELELEAFLKAQQSPNRAAVQVVFIATKLDKVPSSQRNAILDQLRKSCGRPVIGSALDDREGTAALWRQLRRLADLPPVEAPAA